VIVVDASAAVFGLLNDGEARATLAEEAVVCPHLADSENWLVPQGDEGRAERLPDKCTIRLRAGDVLRVLTPGGGGWGAPSAGAERRMRQDRRTTVDLVRFERGEPDVARAPRVRTVGTATESPGRAILHGPTRGWGIRFALGRTPA